MQNKRWKTFATGLTLACLAGLVFGPVLAETTNRQTPAPPARAGHITGKSVVAGALSLLVWPGIGQAVNDSQGKKVATHAVLGILPPYRFWSAYDALVDRKSGYWNGKI